MSASSKRGSSCSYHQSKAKLAPAISQWNRQIVVDHSMTQRCKPYVRLTSAKSATINTTPTLTHAYG